MEIIRIRNYEEERILPLYEDCGWTNYTDNPGMLMRAWMHSLVSYAAYEDDELVGIIRCVGDGASIIYIQDLMVKPEYQRRGIGTRLVEKVVEDWPDVYQMVLMTDDTPKSVSFYNSLGFRRSDTLGCVTFLRIVTDGPDAG